MVDKILLDPENRKIGSFFRKILAARRESAIDLPV